MLQMIKGCRINDPSVLNEGYEQIENGFVANVDANHIGPLFESFIRLHNEYCFLILEIPTNAKEETPYSGKFHKDVYYLDGLTPENGISLLENFGQWLIHDGLSSFGIGIHSVGNEIVKDKYNVVRIYTKNVKQYKGFFEEVGIPETDDLKTAWDYFTLFTPGDSFAYHYKGLDIYDLVKHLEQYGLYFAERRERND